VSEALARSRRRRLSARGADATWTAARQADDVVADLLDVVAEANPLDVVAGGETGVGIEVVARPVRTRTAGDVVRAIVGGFGEVLMTLGALLLLMVVYQLFWTNVVSAQAIASGRDDILQGWRDSAPAPAPSPTPMAEPAVGTGFGLLYIPRMKPKVWGLPIVQGTTKDELARGAGHYVGTAMPGGIGNFAIAAHRSTHDEPFANIDALKVGDKVYVRTRDWWFTYTLVKDNPNLTPTDVWVVDPVPGHPGATPNQALITLTTCTPRYGSTGRWAWWGSLTGWSPADSPPDGIVPTS
jgi:sortase A